MTDKGIQFFPNSNAVRIIGLNLYKSLKGGKAVHSSSGFSSSSLISPLFSKSTDKFYYFWAFYSLFNEECLALFWSADKFFL